MLGQCFVYVVLIVALRIPKHFCALFLLSAARDAECAILCLVYVLDCTASDFRQRQETFLFSKTPRLEPVTTQHDNEVKGWFPPPGDKVARF